MAVVLVSAFKIRTPKEIRFTIDAEESVITLRGILFRKKGISNDPLKTWNRAQLKKGVTFTADEGADRLEIVVTATMDGDSSMTSTTVFDPAPPATSSKKVKLKGNEGIAERLYLFLPINKKES